MAATANWRPIDSYKFQLRTVLIKIDPEKRSTCNKLNISLLYADSEKNNKIEERTEVFTMTERKRVTEAK